jgi:uncharacterized protein
MPGTYTYPGIYLEEIPSGVRTISGVSTSDTAFIDVFAQGPTNRAVRVTSFEDFERRFGGLDSRSEGSYAIQQYYGNGGSIAWVVRIAIGADPATATHGSAGSYISGVISSGAAGDALEVSAANPGEWGNRLEFGIDHNGTEQVAGQPIAFNLVVRERRNRRITRSEVFRNVNNSDTTSARFVSTVVNGISSLIAVRSLSFGLLPAATHPDAIAAAGDVDAAGFVPLLDGTDGVMPTPATGGPAQWNAQAPDAMVDGMRLLERIAPDIFNLMCIPAATTLNDLGYRRVISEATTFCRNRRAFFIADVPASETLDTVLPWMTARDALRSDHSALYFPRLRISDPNNENRPREVGPSGTLAGIYARTDAQRGVWKAPAGTDAVLRGVIELVHALTDLENGNLNVSGINVLRSFPIFGPVSWGARTLDGADQKASEYKYIPVRRIALYIEESLYQGLKWVVFEPNDEPLWSQIRLNVGAFMNNLFRLGAFQGATAREAYFVRCDKETTTQNDIDRGIVNIIVGFAPLKPVEFVVIRIQQIAGQIAA